MDPRGWGPFGPLRRVTRASEHVLLELDGRPALSLYQSYLREDARNLPASGLLFPLGLIAEDRPEIEVIRALLGVDRTSCALILAGDVPQGGLVRLMHATLDGLVTGAGAAAQQSRRPFEGALPELSLLFTCVGRRLLLGRNSEQELDAVRDTLGTGVPMAGFYSNGEIGPFAHGARCELHNQTMTITTMSESP
jgi:hypothetical protein